MDYLLSPVGVVSIQLALLLAFLLLSQRKLVKLVFKSLARNPRRSILSGLAIFVLVFVVDLIWSVLWFLDIVTAEKASDFKVIITERWQIPSQMPFSYAASLAEGAAAKPSDVRPIDHMTWQFYGGTLDPAKRTRENILFFFCMDPTKLPTMMDGLDQLTGAELAMLNDGIRIMQKNKRAVIVGRDRLAAMNKKVGERIKVTGLNYKDIDLEVEIAGEFPPGRYDQSAVLHRDYLNDAVDDYNRKAARAGKEKHPLSEKSLNLVWLKVPDTQAFKQVSGQIMNSSSYSSPAVKCETASSGVAAFLDAYRDLLWGMRYLLVPAILVTMSLVIANAISINVRERRPEMAVMKVLGFGPNTIMTLVLSEALLIGVLCGFLSSLLTWHYINHVVGGFKFPIAFFPSFMIPDAALWWGPVLGGATSFVGSALPAWSARSVKVSEVFAKIS